MRLNEKTRQVEMTEGEYHSLVFGDGTPGFCLACGSDCVDCEPDARRRKCEGCGERRVYGIEELMVMGKITLIEPGEDDYDEGADEG